MSGVAASHVLEEADFVGRHGEFAVAGLEAGHLVEHREGVDAEHGLVGGGGQRLARTGRTWSARGAVGFVTAAGLGASTGVTEVTVAWGSATTE